MKIVILLTLTFPLFFFSGCAAGIVGKIPEVKDDYATVYIARKGGGWVGCGSAILIRINDQDFIRLDCGMKTSFRIMAGEKIKISQVSSMRPDHIYLEPEKNENYYFGADCNFGSCWFDELPKREYKRIEATCDKELKINQ